MALTSSTSEKFAFLFSGSISSRYLNDLERVYTTLTQYYGYQSSKVWLVLGNDPGPAPALDPYPGLKAASNKTFINGTESNLLSVFNTFATAATNSATEDPEPTNVALIYCTGIGGNTGGSKLDINGSGSFTAGTYIEPVWFKNRFIAQYSHTPYNLRFGQTAFVHMVMQQGFGGGFVDSINSVSGLGNWSFTSACASNEMLGLTDDGNAGGGLFTEGWTNALRFTTDGSGNYADELDFDPASQLKYHISLLQAKKFAENASYGPPASPVSLSRTPAWSMAGEIPYIGLVNMKIEDSPPAIIIKHNYSGDNPAFATGFDNCYLLDSPGVSMDRNDVEVVCCNTGSHPVRHYRVDAAIYHDTEILGADEPSTKSFKEKDSLVLPGNCDSPIILDGFDLCDVNYNLVVARTSLEGNTVFEEADPVGNGNEAQLVIAFVHDEFICHVETYNISASGLCDGSFKVTFTGGVGPYFLLVDGVPVTVTSNPLTTGGLCAGTHNLTAHDSDTPVANSCSQTFEIGDPGTVVTPYCHTLLENNYLLICRRDNNDLKFLFKKYPYIPRGYFRARKYKIKWKSPFPVTSVPARADDFIELRNMTIISRGTSFIGRDVWSYMTLRVAAHQTGELLLKHPPKEWPFNNTRLEIPVKIYFKRIFGLWYDTIPWPLHRRWPRKFRFSWPWGWPWPWLWPWLWPWSCYKLIARFKLIIFHGTYDIIEY